MSDTAAAIRAAREVQADVLAPDLFRRANEIFFKAKREYKFKNFREAKLLANQSRKLAEQAEFDSIKSGATRSESEGATSYEEIPGQANSSGRPKETGSSAPGQPGAPGPSDQQPYAYPTPEPTPADIYEQRKKEENSAANPPPTK